MTNVHKLALALLLIVVVASCSAERSGGNVDTAKLDGWLTELGDAGFRGAVLVEKDGTAAIESGFGSTDVDGENMPIGTDTRFDLGSITKDVVDLTILLLEGRAELSRDATLGEILPGVPEDKAGVTITKLMQHSAGFAHAHGSDEETINKSEALGRILAQELRFPPGTDEYYSNSGYTLIAAVLEEVTGQAFEEVLRVEIFTPAGMTYTGFKGEPPPDGADEAGGYGEDGTPRQLSERPPIGWTLQGNGGIVSTVADLRALGHALCDGSSFPPEVIEQLGMCGGTGAVGMAGGGSEYSHTAGWEMDLDAGVSVIVLSAEWEFPAEDVALALMDAVIDGADLPAVTSIRENG